MTSCIYLAVDGLCEQVYPAEVGARVADGEIADIQRDPVSGVQPNDGRLR